MPSVCYVKSLFVQGLLSLVFVTSRVGYGTINIKDEKNYLIEGEYFDGKDSRLPYLYFLVELLYAIDFSSNFYIDNSSVLTWYPFQ